MTADRPAPLHRAALAAALLSLLSLLSVGASPWAASPAGPAGPSVETLLAVCERGLARGGPGVDAAMCEWYAAPCACKPQHRRSGAEPWCVPEGEGIETTVAKVLAELRRAADPKAPAESAVESALRRLYPCAMAP